MRILRPLCYCAFRQEGDCERFASERLLGMPLCELHLERVAEAAESEDVEWVEEDVDNGRESGKHGSIRAVQNKEKSG